MAASTLSDNLRIQLNFMNFTNVLNSKHLKVWFLVNFKHLDTIEDLICEIVKRFELEDSSETLQLTLDGSILPRWENIKILRDNDLIRVSNAEQKKRKRQTEEAENGQDQEMEVDVVEKSHRSEDCGKKQKIQPESALEIESVHGEGNTVVTKKKKKSKKNKDLSSTKTEEVSVKKPEQDQDEITEVYSTIRVDGYPVGAECPREKKDSVNEQSDVAVKIKKSKKVKDVLPQTTVEASVGEQNEVPPNIVDQVPTDAESSAVFKQSLDSGLGRSDDACGNTVTNQDQNQTDSSISDKFENNSVQGSQRGRKNRTRTRRGKRRKNDAEKALINTQIIGKWAWIQDNTPVVSASAPNTAPAPSAYNSPLQTETSKVPDNSKKRVDTPYPSRSQIKQSRDESYGKHVIYHDSDAEDDVKDDTSMEVCESTKDAVQDGAIVSTNCSADAQARFKRTEEQDNPIVNCLAGAQARFKRTEEQDNPIVNCLADAQTCFKVKGTDSPTVNCSADAQARFQRTEELTVTERILKFSESPSNCEPDLASRPNLQRNHNPTMFNAKANSNEKKKNSVPNPFANVQIFSRPRPPKKIFDFTENDKLQTKTDSTLQAQGEVAKPEEAPVPKDYTVYNQLHGPPRPGDVIAFKVLEMSEDYSPVISGYKEAKVLTYNPLTKMAELECLPTEKQTKKNAGRFEVTIEDEDEILTNSNINEGKLITVSWSSLHETRLMT